MHSETARAIPEFRSPTSRSADHTPPATACEKCGAKPGQPCMPYCPAPTDLGGPHDHDGPAAGQGDQIPAITTEALALTVKRHAPADEVLELITWNVERVTAAHGITDQTACARILASAHASLAYAIVCRYGNAGIEADNASDLTDRHLARLPDIPREVHHALLIAATRLHTRVDITIERRHRLMEIAAEILA